MHLKRLNTPKRWNIPKKSTTFITKASSGPHPKDLSIPLVVMLRDHIKIVETLKDCKRIVNEKLVLVDNVAVSDVKRPVGLFDIISIPSHNIYYRIVLDYKGGIVPLSISKTESLVKPFSILNKTRVKGNKIQFNCTSGRNILLKDGKYKTGDTLIIDLDKKKVTKHLPAKEGAHVLVMYGKHAGEIVKIKGFKNFESVMKDRVILVNDKGAEYETMKNYVFVIGEKDIDVKIREEKK